MRGALRRPFPATLSVSDTKPPLLKNTMEDVATPAAVGMNVTPNFMEAPTARLPLVGPTVKKGFDEVTDVIFRVLEASKFVTVTLSIEGGIWIETAEIITLVDIPKPGRSHCRRRTLNQEMTHRRC